MAAWLVQKNGLPWLKIPGIILLVENFLLYHGQGLFRRLNGKFFKTDFLTVQNNLHSPFP